MVVASARNANRPGERGAVSDRVGRIIAMLNLKGGTGKTTTIVNLAAGLSLAGRRVLAIDIDPQGGLASSLGVTFDYSLTDLLVGEATPRQTIVRARPGFDLIPSTTRRPD